MSPGERGDFKVTVDGVIHWDKKNNEHRFPDETQFVASLRG